MKIKNNKILVTCALPYSNGPIHLGHMLEQIQADIWVRYKRMVGNNVYFICSDDSHGTAIMLKSKKINILPKKMINKIKIRHKLDFSKFNITHNYYDITNNKNNKKMSKIVYLNLKENGFIKIKKIFQLYDKNKKMFLPDRFIKGLCPICKSKDQYGDNCEICGSTYNAINLIKPKSILSNSEPIIRKSNHIFFDLPYFKNLLKKWIKKIKLQKIIYNKIYNWLKIGLKKWDISRDKPYFGFKIPGFKNKYFYVWLDAPISYISTFYKFCKIKININFKKLFKPDSKLKFYNFIGKDIIYFHGLFWPAILEGINFKKPNNIFVHGYLTIDKYKMSKSRGTFIKANDWLKFLDSDSLRYYYASKLSININDININLYDFMKKINSNIVNKIINLASRNSKFINNYFKNKLSKVIEDKKLYKKFVNESYKISKLFNLRKFNHVINKIIDLTDIANNYIDNKSPWKLSIIKNKNLLHNISSMGINLFKILVTFLKPIIPELIIKIEKFLNISLTWNSIYYPLLNHKIKNFKKLYYRINVNQINKIISFYKK
ncbi:Methionine--tRNA ligase [Candidatus Annandia adelgestsuga]|uniref:Methionine--tRNA ligase n=1 Tax=Candidatus Annandia adelgestsuga TaxID=1302411 RepID=A0A3Q9CLV2_9ENTR|nr:methionine--tRNA ligase [Candidatus Annandia adelgestsuga]AZP36365.1 Methionine--tRNA ligase [Candidatus Annandia adelgestsuga]